MKKALKWNECAIHRRTTQGGRCGRPFPRTLPIQRILKVACQPPEIEPSLTTSQIGRPPLPLYALAEEKRPPELLAEIWNWHPKMPLWYLTLQSVEELEVVPLNCPEEDDELIEKGGEIEPPVQLDVSSVIVAPN
jgi:hypothetical protein